MSKLETLTIPAGHAKALRLSAGSRARVINLEGSQVVDVWALGDPDVDEYLSNEHTRSCLEKLTPAVGDSLYSNRRRPILRLVEDTSPGVHDLLLSACDVQRYRLLGHLGPHRSCTENFYEALAEVGCRAQELPSPFNLFENVAIGEGGRLTIESPPVKAGEFATLAAERDLILVLSACPMDIALTNGPDGRTKPVAVEIASP